MSEEEARAKEELRNHFSDLRMNLSVEECRRKSNRIRNGVIETAEFRRSKTIHTYISMPHKKEVDTVGLIEYMLEAGKNVVVPKMVGDGELNHIHLRSLDQLERNAWGVQEPRSGRGVSVQEPDLILVPMVAGDWKKNRLGYGKGYYDRFLSESNAVKMGLLYEIQLSKVKIPVEPFDISLDILVTEKRRID
jgi:5-formyltetrahydrofolate cyclo-ligase